MEVSKLSEKKLLSALDKQRRLTLDLCDLFIAAGRGDETFSVTSSKSDELSVRYVREIRLESLLLNEKTRRMDYHGKLSPIKDR